MTSPVCRSGSPITSAASSGLPPPLFVPAPDRPATATDHATLWAWRVVLPAQTTLERLVIGCAAEGEEATWRRIQRRLPRRFRARLDSLLVVPEGSRLSPLQGFKLYPPSARPGDILSYLERSRSLHSLGVAKVDLAGVGSELLEHLAELARRYDVDDLKRFVPAKRHAPLACFLAEAHKSTLDHLVEMHRESSRAWAGGPGTRLTNAIGSFANASPRTSRPCCTP